MADKPTFESLIPAIETQIEKRRGSWRLTSVAWEDVKQLILTKVFFKYDSPTAGYIPEKGPFSHWLSRVITNTMTNILRDSHTKFSRPCVTGCVFNTGGDSCSRTTSGIQCSECPIYKRWEERKLDHYRVQQTLPLENHAQEVNSMPSDFIDIAGSKDIIDAKMKDKLDEHEYSIYCMIYIEGKTEKEVGKLLGYKKTGAKTYEGYQMLLKLRKHIVLMAREIIEEENLT
jgi:DNA-directed RNA polymerase specialized sigma24 family protein